MLPLIKVQDTVQIVCTTDPSVKVKAAERELPQWKPASEVRHNGDTLVVSIRPLSSSEMLRCQGFLLEGPGGQVDLTIHAAKNGVVKIAGPGVDCDTEEDINALLERLQPGELASLGGYVLEQSLQAEGNPTEATT